MSIPSDSLWFSESSLRLLNSFDTPVRDRVVEKLRARNAAEITEPDVRQAIDSVIADLLAHMTTRSQAELTARTASGICVVAKGLWRRHLARVLMGATGKMPVLRAHPPPLVEQPEDRAQDRQVESGVERQIAAKHRPVRDDCRPHRGRRRSATLAAVAAAG